MFVKAFKIIATTLLILVVYILEKLYSLQYHVVSTCWTSQPYHDTLLRQSLSWPALELLSPSPIWNLPTPWYSCSLFAEGSIKMHKDNLNLLSVVRYVCQFCLETRTFSFFLHIFTLIILWPYLPQFDFSNRTCPFASLYIHIFLTY